jgi:hypothetical protein
MKLLLSLIIFFNFSLCLVRSQGYFESYVENIEIEISSFDKPPRDYPPVFKIRIDPTLLLKFYYGLIVSSLMYANCSFKNQFLKKTLNLPSSQSQAPPCLS